MCHRSGRISPSRKLFVAEKKFPIIPRIAGLPLAPPDSHLEHTVIPKRTLSSSLEVFLGRLPLSLASFAETVSSGDRLVASANAARRSSQIHCPHSRQATLYTAHMHRIAGLILFSSLSYQDRSPRYLGRCSHAVASRPNILTFSNSPSLGNSSHHQKLHRYARRRYFTPVFGAAQSD